MDKYTKPSIMEEKYPIKVRLTKSEIEDFISQNKITRESVIRQNPNIFEQPPKVWSKKTASDWLKQDLDPKVVPKNLLTPALIAQYVINTQRDFDALSDDMKIKVLKISANSYYEIWCMCSDKHKDLVLRVWKTLKKKEKISLMSECPNILARIL